MSKFSRQAKAFVSVHVKYVTKADFWRFLIPPRPAKNLHLLQVRVSKVLVYDAIGCFALRLVQALKFFMNPFKVNFPQKPFNIPYRFLFIILLIIFQALTIIAVLLATRRNTEATLRTHAVDVMEHVVRTVSDQTLLYLAPAEKSAAFTAALISNTLLDANDEASLETYFLAQLESNEQIEGIFLGKEDGDFVFVSRNGEGFRSKFIRVDESGREVELLFRNAAKEQTEQRLDPDDTYDPRARPWYTAAMESNEVIWTDPYIFFSAQIPGITAAIRTEFGVIGVDIALDALSDFIASIPIGEQGSALIQTENGLAVAYPSKPQDPANPVRTLPKAIDTVGPILKTISQSIGSDEIKEASFSEIKLQENYFAMVSPFTIGNNTWYILVQAPAKDFIGSVQKRYRRSLFEILAIGFLTCLLATPLSLSIALPLKQLHQRATTDELTGLLNRNEFVTQASRFLRSSHSRQSHCVLAIIDLDGFKPINDNFGHLVGDEVLSTVGNRLMEATRQQDIVGRIGGDEFAVFLPDVSAANAAETVERIRKKIGSFVISTSAGKQVIGATAGFAVTKGDRSLIHLIAQADNALISGKLIEKNQTYGPLPSSKTAGLTSLKEGQSFS